MLIVDKVDIHCIIAVLCTFSLNITAEIYNIRGKWLYCWREYSKRRTQKVISIQFLIKIWINSSIVILKMVHRVLKYKFSIYVVLFITKLWDTINLNSDEKISQQSL